MPVTSSYGVPGSATYSQDLGDLDHMMSALPDNTINQITAKNVRDSSFTMYNMIQSAIAANLYQVTSVGNTTSHPIQIGGLQVSGTTSLYNNLRLLSTISDYNGATGVNGYVITATNGGLVWAPQNSSGISATPSLQQVLQAGHTASSNYIMYGAGVFNNAIVVNGNPSSSWCAVFARSVIINSTIEDTSGSTGPSGYILSATANGVAWIPNTGAGGGNLFQTTTLGNTTSNSIIINGTGTPKYSIILSATMGSIMAFSGSSNPTASYGSYRHNGITYKDQSATYVLNVPPASNQVVSLPPISGTIAVMSQMGIDTVLSNGNTSSRFASIGSLAIATTASFGSFITVGSGGVISSVGGATFGGYANLNNTSIANLYVSGTAAFIGTASFAKGILDNYNSYGTTYSVLTIDNTGKVKWQTGLSLQFNIVSSTSSYTLTLPDVGRMISITSSISTLVTVPTNASVAFPIGSWITITQYGVGGVSFQGASGVLIDSKTGYVSISAQFVTVTLTKMGTNAWILTGDLTP